MAKFNSNRLQISDPCTWGYAYGYLVLIVNIICDRFGLLLCTHNKIVISTNNMIKKIVQDIVSVTVSPNYRSFETRSRN